MWFEVIAIAWGELGCVATRAGEVEVTRSGPPGCLGASHGGATLFRLQHDSPTTSVKGEASETDDSSQ